MEKVKPSVFQYLDLRSYLKDYINFYKKSARRFSYRALARDIGFKVPNFLQQVLESKRSFNEEHTLLMAKHLDLNKKEQDYFFLLIEFDNCKKHIRKNELYQKLIRSCQHTNREKLLKKHYKYCEQWYHPVVRELALNPAYTGDPLWIVQRIYPRLTKKQVDRSLELLVELKLIQHQPHGNFTSNEKVIQTNSQAPSSVISNYHREMLKIASNSIESFHSKDRDIRAVTATLNEKQVKVLKEKLEVLWHEVMELSQDDNQSDKVFQLNTQLFPLTHKGRKQ